MPFKIHPGIGIARVGDSPSDWFIGPETVALPPIPTGGYRDAECRIKRQGARFRIREYDASGNLLPVEVTSDNAVITWTVHLAGAVSPPARSVAGANQVADIAAMPFTSPAMVSLGQLRTDEQGRLIVLSGVVEGSFSGRADGFVRATVQRGAEAPVDALAAWVVVAPPDFAPPRRPVSTYYDRLFQRYVTHGLFGVSVPASPSFAKDVYPLLRARNAGRPLDPVIEAALPWLADANQREDVANIDVDAGAPPAAAEPVTQTQITSVQWQILANWVNGSFDDDWATASDPIALTPFELDRGPLSHATGAPLGGWEIGSGPLAPARFEPATLAYVEPFRFDPAVVTFGATLGTLPWQSDLSACVLEWAAQAEAPNVVVGAAWQTRGFMVLQGDDLEYVEDCSVPYVALLTPSVDFGAVAQGPSGGVAYGSAAIVFEVGSTMSAVELVVVSPLPAGLTAVTPSETVGPLAAGEIATVKLWLTYTTGALGSELDEVIQVQHTGGELYDVRVRARTVAPVTTKLALVLDCSYSMLESAGGASKLQRLKDAVDVLIDVAREHDGIGIAPFSANALAALDVVPLGPNVALEPGRAMVRAFAFGLAAQTSTSIGDGLVRGRQVLADASGSYGAEALIVVTDGKETAPEWIADVADEIDERTFAVGIGTGANVDASTLQTLTGNRGGYLLLTGPLAGSANQFTLEKYLLQVLSGTNNENVIVDPVGSVLPNAVERIPFPVTDAEFTFDAIVTSDDVARLAIGLQAPNGEIITPDALATGPVTRYVAARRVAFYRVELPLALASGESARAGVWHLLIALRERQGGDPKGDRERFVVAPSVAASAAARSGKAAAYCAVVNTRSALDLNVTVEQPSSLPGAPLLVEATLSCFGAPFRGVADLRAEIADESGSMRSVSLVPAEPGRFVARHELLRSGTYRVRVRANGYLGAQRFARELQASAAVGRSFGEPGRCRPCADPPGAKERPRRGHDSFAKALCDIGAQLCDLGKRALGRC
jgi:hypothetical protein